MVIPIRLLNPQARLPHRAKPGDAAYDLCTSHYVCAYPGKPIRVDIGIAMAIPEGYYGSVRERSGLAGLGMRVGGGVIDSSYRGSIQVVLHNLSQDNFYFEVGDRVAQLIIEKCYDAEWQEISDLGETTRGASGFGSSGT